MTKEELHELVFEMINNKIIECTDLLVRIDESAQNETKSSAGDKFETGRAMMQQEYDKVYAQKLRWQEMLLRLKQIEYRKTSNLVALGSLVQTEKASFYISVALGKIIKIGAINYYAISLESPLGKALQGRSQSDIIQVNSAQMKIIALL